MSSRNSAPMHRREVLNTLGAALLMTPLAKEVAASGLEPTSAPERVPPPRDASEPFGYSFNTSTTRGQKLPLPRLVDLVAEAGYGAIEPWVAELDLYESTGDMLGDLRKRIADRGLTVESAIGFFDWIVDDDEKRRNALEQAKRVMNRLAQIGGKRVAAPPAGAVERNDLDPRVIAERFAALVAVGREEGIIPQVEVWGFSKTLQRLGEAAYVAVECGSTDARILADVYHLHKGGSGFTGLGVVHGRFMDVFHMNDYPEDPPPASIQDRHRVFPGDGVAPLGQILRTLYQSGFRGWLSLELFNEDYWKRDALKVMIEGLEKMRKVVKAAGLASA